MPFSSRLPWILACALAATGCLQSPAPILIVGAEPARAISASPAVSGPTKSAASAPARTAEGAAASPSAAGDAPSRYSLSALGDATLAAHDLAIPVAGVAPDQLRDSFDSPRAGDRRHHAIDILAPRGTPVTAADDGRVLRVSSNTLGGLTVYTVDRSGAFVFYYAHLEGYARGLKAGNIVFKGDTLGFVGTTGDAPDNVPHLHFQILRMPPDGKYWNGDPIDPFPLLSGRGARILGNH